MSGARVALDSRGEVLLLECPGCEMLHAIRVRARAGGVLPFDGPVWVWNDSLEEPTCSPSVLVRFSWGPQNEPRCCHFFLRSGRLEFLTDCTHPLAGRTIDLPMLPSPPEVP